MHTMSSSQLKTVSSFVEGAPPGEVNTSPLRTVLSLLTFTIARGCHRRYSRFLPDTNTTCTKPLDIDIKALTLSSPSLISQLGPAFEKYNEEQFATVKLPGSSKHVSLSLQIEGAELS